MRGRLVTQACLLARCVAVLYALGFRCALRMVLAGVCPCTHRFGTKCIASGVGKTLFCTQRFGMRYAWLSRV